MSIIVLVLCLIVLVLSLIDPVSSLFLPILTLLFFFVFGALVLFQLSPILSWLCLCSAQLVYHQPGPESTRVWLLDKGPSLLQGRQSEMSIEIFIFKKTLAIGGDFGVYFAASPSAFFCIRPVPKKITLYFWGISCFHRFITALCCSEFVPITYEYIISFCIGLAKIILNLLVRTVGTLLLSARTKSILPLYFFMFKRPLSASPSAFTKVSFPAVTSFSKKHRFNDTEN